MLSRKLKRIAPRTAAEAEEFLGPLAQEFLVFCDPDRTAVKSLGLSSLPAFVVVRGDGKVAGAAEGWDPAAWKSVAKAIAAHPILLQRPVVVSGKRAAIGRPPEAVLSLLK